jgi:DNA modification methylase
VKKKPLTPAQIRKKPGGQTGGSPANKTRYTKPPISVFTTTLWEYPSQHHDADDAPGKRYTGATPSWVIWQLLQRYTREGDLVVDPFAGSGTTIDVSLSNKRRSLGYDLNPDSQRPPYSTHVEYSDDPRCIGRLDAGSRSEQGDIGAEYYDAMDQVFAEAHRVLKPGRYLAVYISDSYKKRSPNSPAVEFMPIGFELFALLRKRFKPVDIIAVVRHNKKLEQGNWKKAAVEQNFYLRGFNYCLIFKKDAAASPPPPLSRGESRKPKPPRPRKDAR